LEDYRTEEEQVEAIKRWWDENGKSTVVAIVLAVVASFSWRYWQDEQQRQREQASVVYQQLLDFVSQNSLDDNGQKAALSLANQIESDYASSGYATLAGLAKASIAMSSADFGTAESALLALKAKKLDPEMAALVNIRLAKVQFSKGDLTAAMATLGGDMQKFAAQAAELRGDILAAQGNNAAALDAYNEAQVSASESENMSASPLLRIKIESLANAKGDKA
jgi:predicted negative regulator of RcsB-dependent stress response